LLLLLTRSDSQTGSRSSSTTTRLALGRSKILAAVCLPAPRPALNADAGIRLKPHLKNATEIAIARSVP
jgi:hypothetical protein